MAFGPVRLILRTIEFPILDCCSLGMEDGLIRPFFIWIE